MATLSLFSMVAIVPAMVGVPRGGQSRRTWSRAWSRTRSSMWSRKGRRTLMERFEGSII